MPASSSAPQPGQVWYIQAAERVWGPYPQARLASFVVDRRLTADSLIATHASGPFGPAGRRRELERLFEPFATAPEAPEPTPAPTTLQPMPASPTPAPAAATPAQPRAATFSRKPPQNRVAAGAPLRALVVWADLTSLSSVAFEVALAHHGAFVGVRPGVWLIRSASEAASLRNALSRALTGEDALLVLEAPLERAAWFNLDHEAEWNLRQLWSGGEV